ncbi:MAG: hypothetical protein J6U73_01815 [Alistipes sp.]|nr:hypothetical protein [Alistipes sp.]
MRETKKTKNFYRESYEAPLVAITEVEVEQGFAISTESLEDRNDDIDW